MFFREAIIQNTFNQKGYVKIPLLSQEQADSLYLLFKETKNAHDFKESLHHTTTDTQNIELIRKIDTAIKNIFVPELKKVFLDFKPLAGCFHIKEPGAGSATGIHQDPTFVDEKLYNSANVWVALHDMNEQNGNLFFIPGSNKIQCLRITPDSPNYYASFNDSLGEMAIQEPLKKGEALIFNNATIHGATDNLSADLRLAATLLVCPAAAKWQIYYRDKNSTNDSIEKFNLDFESFISMTKNGRPNQDAFHEYIEYDFPNLTKKEFLNLTRNEQNLQRYFGRIKSFFKRNKTA